MKEPVGKTKQPNLVQHLKLWKVVLGSCHLFRTLYYDIASAPAKLIRSYGG